MKPSQLRQLLEHAIPAGLPILVKGAPGIGKSDLVAQACHAAKTQLVISHPVVSDPTDYKGLPYPVEGKAEFLPFGDLERLISANTPLVYFLDDLGQAPPSVQAACMQLILARRINGHQVSDHVTFLAATNRKADRAGVSGILEPVKSRFAAIVELEPDLEDWIAWALTAGMPTELIAFVRFRPSLLHDFRPTADITNTPCPRTVARVGKWFNLGLPPDLEYDTYAGAAGEGFAAEFLAFVKIFRSLPDPDRVLMDPAAAPVPDDPATMYALAGALAQRAGLNNADRFFQYAGRVSPEFSVLMVRDALHRTSALTNTRGYIAWATAHGDVLI